METKFLSDGRKVAIVGSLNQQETIVQEIFVTDSGDEIPSGERFVTKSLHDEPVKSWKQREAEKAELLYEKRQSEKKALDIEIRQLQAKRKGHQELIKSNLTVIEKTTNLSEDDIDLIACVASGNVKWIVDDYHWWKRTPFDKETFQYEGRFDYRDCEFEGIKMITLLGVGGGNYRFEINRWRDGSGHSKGALFFKDDEQLKEYLLGKIKEHDSLSLEQISHMDGFIDIPRHVKDKAVKDLEDRAQTAYEKAVNDAKDRLSKSLESIIGKQ